MTKKASNPHGPLLSDGVHLVTRRIAEIGCMPYDSIIVYSADPREPYMLLRALDSHDVEMLLSASALRQVPDSFWDTIPSRADLRRRRKERVLTVTKAGTIRAVTDRSTVRLVP